MNPETIRLAKNNHALAQNLGLILIVIGLAVCPLVMLNNAEFRGADGNAEQAINDIQASYTPWFAPLWQPPSGEIESLLFALQAAAGAGFIGYYIGYARGRRKSAELTQA